MLRRFSLAALVLTAFSLSAMNELSDVDFENATLEFSSEVTRSTGSDEKTRLLYDNAGFFVREEAKDVRVNGYDTDKFFQGKGIKDIAKYSQIGKFKVSKFDNGEYSVKTCGDLKGGGPVLAVIAAFGVRFVGYTASIPWIFVPGGQPIFLAGCQITELTANYATVAAAVVPTP